ncbi:HEPN domain-containing protein [Cupriavidus sp. UGS-1]|uniref:HEPN domain-containing protein n=1 Tax=Cupriavidus sp. UGS-1 TaxID=2899826 RepID=UPI001E38E738|nr:HEPN domain-containing protein [Cupriavidus sp. UGS-1]MCD9121462.1 HEPN domain-containing protein [Cupriavidus sp. UGS-1]
MQTNNNMARITESELLLISKAKLEKLRNFADGVSICRRSRSTIDRLRARVAKDRLRLAQLQLNDAIKSAALTPKLSRAAVSRAYYAMYHAARAATYLSYGGDDHEEHSALPSKLPANFPDLEQWRNKLKFARLERNRADYDPYPVDDTAFEDTCDALIQDATELIRVAQRYINQEIRSKNGS